MNMDVIGIIALISALSVLLAVINQFFNLRDRFVRWIQNKRRSKFKTEYREDNPDFKFSFNYNYSTPPGSCIISVSIINRSKELKFINMISYKFRDRDKDVQVTVPHMILRQDQFPKRLEHGQPYHFNEEFKHNINNTIYECWRKGVKVYATCETTTGDLLRSNGVEYDKLAERLVPFSEEYQKVAKRVFSKYGGVLRDIEASVYQLQIFNRITSNIVKQLEINRIPVLQFLSEKFGIVLNGTDWYQFYQELERKKIPPPILIEHLDSLVE